MFSRTVRILDAGIKPMCARSLGPGPSLPALPAPRRARLTPRARSYVFDGAAPTMKSGELAKRRVGLRSAAAHHCTPSPPPSHACAPTPRARRREKKADADEKLAAAKEAGNAEDVEKYGKAGIRVTREQTEECKRLLRLMGVPVVEAPCEAEATCAALCAAGLVHSVGSEDMDTLTFGAPRLSRNLMKPANADAPVLEITLAAALAELGLSREQFVDVCILIGCDYLDPIKGCGPVSALKLITDHGSIEAALPGMRKNGKYTVPEVWPYQEARDLFLKPLVADVAALPEFKWTPPDEAGLLAFLVGEKTFAEERVRKSIDKVKAAKGKATQNRLESFFGAPTTVKSTLGVKRAAGANQGG